MPKRRKTVTASGDSDPQGPAHDGGIVPAPRASSSSAGRSGVLPTGTPVKDASVEDRRGESGTTGESDRPVRLAGSGEGGRTPEESQCLSSLTAIMSLLSDMEEGRTSPRLLGELEKVEAAVLELTPICQEAFRKIRLLEKDMEERDRDLAVHRKQVKEAIRPKREVVKEVKELRAELSRVKAEAGSLRAPEPDRRSAGVQCCLPPAEKGKVSVGVRTDPPPTTVDRGTQTPPNVERVDGGTQTPPNVERVDGGTQTPSEERVDGGAGAWSADRVGALIDQKMRTLRDDIVAEVYGGTVDRPPVRRRDAPPAPPVAPGPAPASDDAGVPWSRVLGRKARRGEKEGARPVPRPSRPGRGAPRGGAAEEGGRLGRKPRLPRPPGTAAIVLAPVRGEEGVDVEAAADLAMGDSALAGCGDLGIKARRTAAGGLLLQIPGEDGPAKADELAAGIRRILADKGVSGVRVDRPVKLADLRVTGLVGPVTPAKVARALAESAGCGEGELRVGAIVRRSPLGPGSAWVRMPVVAARRVVAAGSVRVGWLTVGVTPIESRPMRCYRCFGVGHAGQRCTATEDRGGRCFRCGEPGHLARECAAPAVRCPLCADLGRRSDHRLGAAACTPSAGGGGGKGGRTGDGGGASALSPRPTRRRKRSGGDDSPPPPKRDGSGAGAQSSARTRVWPRVQDMEVDPAVPPVAGTETSLVPQGGWSVEKRGAGDKLPPAEEDGPGPSGVDARGTGIEGGVT